MVDLTEERDWWNSQARTRLELSVWGVEGQWEEGIALCVDAVVPELPTNPTRLLDLGCGPGRLTKPIAGLFPAATIVGVDISAVMLEEASRNTPQASFMLGDGCSLPDVGVLDGAWSVLMFQHCSAAVSAGYVEQVAVALRRGGRFRFQVCVGPQRSWMNHGVSEEMVFDWCADAGLTVETVDRGLIYAEWLWVTAVK